MEQRIVEKTVVNAAVTVVTMDRVDDHEVVGLHATYKTFVIGMPDIDPNVAYVCYGTERAAELGHQQVVAETRRAILKKEATEVHGIPAVTVEGWL